MNRSNTVKTYRPERLGQQWQPGQEPGIDPSAPLDQYSSSTAPKFNENCQITTVDFSQDEMQQHELDNHTLGQYLTKARPEWALCRWINVNGLSWDVVKLLGNHYGLHRLAVEDLLNPRNRTKADWYTDHTYMVLPLQKLIHLHSDSDCESEASEWEDQEIKERRDMHRKKTKKRSVLSKLTRPLRARRSKKVPPKSQDTTADLNGYIDAHKSSSVQTPLTRVRTLQR